MSPALNLMVLTAPRVSKESPVQVTALRERALNAVRAAIDHGPVDAIMLLGDLTMTGSVEDFSVLDELVFELLEASLEHPGVEDFPRVLAVPGAADAGGSFDAGLEVLLTASWESVRGSLWGEDGGFLSEALAKRYRNFLNWYDQHRPADARLGRVPGDFSCTFQAAGERVGFLGLNTVFRPQDRVGRPSTLDEGQLAACLGYKSDELVERMDLLVLGAARSAECRGMDLVPTFMLAAESGDDCQDNNWVVGQQITDQKCPLTLLSRWDHISWELRGVRSQVQPRKAYKLGTNSGWGLVEAAVPRSDEADLDELKRLDEILTSGQTVLVLVSGIEQASRNDQDSPLLNLDGLRTNLENRMGVQGSSDLSMDDVFSSALNQQGVADVVTRALVTVEGDENVLVDELLRGPWQRIYDCTGSTVLSAAVSRAPNRNLGAKFVDATIEGPVSVQDRLRVVALNGVADRESGHGTLDFGMPPHRSTSPRALWQRQFLADLASYPILMVAQDTTSRSLKEYLRMLPDTRSAGHQHDVYLLAGGSDPAIHIVGNRKGIIHVKESPAEAFRGRLSRNAVPVKQGRARLLRVRDDEQCGTGIRRVATLLDQARSLSTSRPFRGTGYLKKGRAPEWSDIVTGVPARMSQVGEIMDMVDESKGEQPIVLVKERAGNGKTTNLMNLSVELLNRYPHWDVGWIDRQVDLSVPEVLEQAERRDYDAVLIDDVDIFGQVSSQLTGQLNRQGRTLVVATVRSTRANALFSREGFRSLSTRGRLGDQDLEALIDALDRGQALGALSHVRPRSAQVARLREVYGGNLLVTMHEVVTGVEFGRKIAQELQDLSQDRAQNHVYNLMCMFNAQQNERLSIPRDALHQIAEPKLGSSDTAQAINQLLDKDMIVLDSKGYLRCRHTIFAEKTIEELKGVGSPETNAYLGELIADMLHFYAVMGSQISDRQHPDRRVMVRLLHHDNMLELPADVVRPIYEEMGSILKDDLHYWLQYGSFERKYGEPGRAINLLERARACDGGEQHFQVLTAWSGAKLDGALRNPGDRIWGDGALIAFETLDRVIKSHGAASPHTYQQIITLGGRWVGESRLLEVEERRHFTNEILKHISLAERNLSTNSGVCRGIEQQKSQLEELLVRLDQVGEGGLPVIP